MDFQFYPTPEKLSERAWRLFKNKNITKVLEPSAGTGELMAHTFDRNGRSFVKWDAIEIDPSRHPLLRERGARVVGYDFLSFKEGNVYSHIIMNPPFANGAAHLLHAWNILYDGEIVCILNAETIRNPFSKERAFLVKLIEDHGTVEFIADAFRGEDVERKADVEVALVHLTKTANSYPVVGDVLSALKRDQTAMPDVELSQQLAIPTGFVQDLVLRFDAAVVAAKEVAEATAKLGYYKRILGETLESRSACDVPSTSSVSADFIGSFATQYEEIKDRAWSGFLRSASVVEKLSSKAQQKLESEFEKIKELEFSVSNLYGFLQGLSESANEIQTEMMLEIFDTIIRYHSDNTVFYMGWKSNNKHRTAGMRIKTTRFVLPGHGTETWQKSLPYSSQRMLADFDLVFAMLDGKNTASTYGLCNLFKEKFKELCDGNREASDYFEVRYYPSRGTIHFFPKNKELIDRLNRFVGIKRQWLPQDMAAASKDFVTQYEQAEKFDKAMKGEFKLSQTRKGNRNHEYALVRASCGDEAQNQDVAESLERVLESRGIRPHAGLCYNEEKFMIETNSDKDT